MRFYLMDECGLALDDKEPRPSPRRRDDDEEPPEQPQGEEESEA